MSRWKQVKVTECRIISKREAGNLFQNLVNDETGGKYEVLKRVGTGPCVRPVPL